MVDRSEARPRCDYDGKAEIKGEVEGIIIFFERDHEAADAFGDNNIVFSGQPLKSLLDEEKIDILLLYL